jgi:glycosyltransferase involved in cell wall biosynthesis
MVRIVGSVLVRNEDLFVEQAIRNVAAFCDVIHVVDHASDDRTWSIVQSLARELEHVDARRSRNSAVAHRLLEGYADTDTWVLGVDGDELYDPAGLVNLRRDLDDGRHADVFRLKAHVLNCDQLDRSACTASGWLAPPSRPVTKLFNFAAVKYWRGSPDPLQSGEVVFRDGFEWESRRTLADSTVWDGDPLRLLHVCFLRRSSRDAAGDGVERPNLDESRAYDRGPVGMLRRTLRPHRRPAHLVELERRDRSWKREWYTRGDHVSVDASPFLRP